MRKEVGVIVVFDDVEYSDEERDLLLGRFFHALLKLSQKPKKEIENAKQTSEQKRKIPA